MPVKTKRKGSALKHAIATVREFETLPQKHSKAAASIASQLAPRSDISEAGYIHMADAIFAKKITRTRWIVVVDKAYAVFVEFGTVYQDAQPFFRPAMAAARRAFIAELKRLIQRVRSVGTQRLRDVA